MEIIIKPDYDAVCEETALLVHQAWRKKRNLVLGLPTGNTPLGLYARLTGLFGRGEIDFSEVVTFNLDEYLGLDENHPQSFARYMNEHLFRHVNVKKENTHVLSGTPADVEEHCRAVRKQDPERRAESTSRSWGSGTTVTSPTTCPARRSSPGLGS